MVTLEQAKLSDGERRVVDRFVAELKQRLGEDLGAVWLYGSRARGERPHDRSDVDLLVIATGGRRRHFRTASDLMHDLARAEGEDPFAFSTAVESPEWLDGRREIESFFIQEVDRDKIVLHGEP